MLYIYAKTQKVTQSDMKQSSFSNYINLTLKVSKNYLRINSLSLCSCQLNEKNPMKSMPKRSLLFKGNVSCALKDNLTR